MPKLLMVSTVAGTLKAFLIPYARHFRELGWEVDGAAAGAAEDADCIAAFDAVFHVPWSRKPLSRQNFVQAPAQIRAIVDRGGYDIVHVHTPLSAFLSRYALRHSRRRGHFKIIYTAHGFMFHPRGSKLSNMVYSTLEKIAGRWTDYLVVINQTDREAAERHRLVPSDRLRYMPGIGVDTDFYNPRAVPTAQIQRVRQELGLADQDRLFLMIAEFHPNKRHHQALEALALIRANRIHLAFAGSGSTETAVAELADRLGVASRVHFLGHRSDIPALIRASTATLLMSGREGLPRSILESLSLGVPVIASDIRGVHDLLESGAGILIPPGDCQSLANAVERLANEPDLVASMSRIARSHVMAYDIQKLIVLHEELYRDALNENAVADTIVPDREPRVSQS